jgi:hypothetical protein
MPRQSRWWLAMMMLTPVGCTTSPVADFLDWARPGRLERESGPVHGGVEPAVPPSLVPPSAPAAPPLPPLPDAPPHEPAGPPPPPVWPTNKPPEGPPRAVGSTPELPNFTNH